ncbi:MAG TPA: alpha/beta hydrolase [Candidatus Eisenbacteria bacterium]|nr:alpha/beta hydrolase [Candidatus Eisenbacteria bacterium]
MEKSIRVDGLNICYLEEGSGPAVIFLHGASLGSSARVFERNLPAIARAGFRAIAYDQPGFGLSDNPSDYTVSYRTAFILKFMDALGLQRTALVGHSQAAGMAIRVALRDPARVSHLMAVGGGTVLPPLPGKTGGGPGEGQEGTSAAPTLEDMRKILETNFFDKTLITPELLQKRLEMSVGKNFNAFRERSKAREPQKDPVPLHERLKEVSVPLLLLYGQQDRGSAAERCALLKQQQPALRVELIDRASHMVMWEAADQFNRIAIDFLKS